MKQPTKNNFQSNPSPFLSLAGLIFVFLLTTGMGRSLCRGVTCPIGQTCDEADGQCKGSNGGNTQVTMTIGGDTSQTSSAASQGRIIFVQPKPGNLKNISGVSAASDLDPAVAYAPTGLGSVNVTVSSAADNSLPAAVVVGNDYEYKSNLCDSGDLTFPYPQLLEFTTLNDKDVLTGQPYVTYTLTQTSGSAVDLSNTLDNSEGKGNASIFSRTVFLPGPGFYEFALTATDTRSGATIAQPLGLNTAKVLACQYPDERLPKVHAVKPEINDTSSNVITVQGALATDWVTLEGSAISADGSPVDSIKWLSNVDVNISNSSNISTQANFQHKTGSVSLVAKKGIYKKTDTVKYVFPEGSGQDALINVQIAGSSSSCSPVAPFDVGSHTIQPGPDPLTASVLGTNVAGKLFKYSTIDQYTSGAAPLNMAINEEGKGKLIWVCPPSSQKALILHRIGPGHVGVDPNGNLPISDENIRLYATNTSVTLAPFAEQGYTFDRWFGDVPSGSEFLNPLTVTMTNNRYLAPRFIKNAPAVPSGIIQIQPSTTDLYGINFSLPGGNLGLGANVPDLNHDGSVDALDDAIFKKCVNGPGSPPFGENLLDPGTEDLDLYKCREADFDGDGDVDDVDRKIFMSCFNDSNSPAPGFACLGAGFQPISNYEVRLIKNGTEMAHLFNPTTYHVPTGQEGLYTIESTVGQVVRKTQAELPIRVKLDLGRSEDGDLGTDEGHILVAPQGLGPGEWSSCPSTVDNQPWICGYPPATTIQLTAVPGTGYRFVGWEVQKAPHSVSGLLDLSNPVATITLDWVDGGGPYVIEAVMVRDS